MLASAPVEFSRFEAVPLMIRSSFPRERPTHGRERSNIRYAFQHARTIHFTGCFIRSSVIPYKIVTAPPLCVVRKKLLRQVVPVVVAAVISYSAVRGRFL
jgi:hypothetical protein